MRSLVITILSTFLFSGSSFQLTHKLCTKPTMRLSKLSMAGQIPMVPYRLRKESKDYQWMDIYNALGRQRTLFVSRFLDDEACNQLIASLIYLQGYATFIFNFYN